MDLTEWSAADFRSAIDCAYSPVQLYGEINLSRCNALLELLCFAVDPTDEVDQRRVAVTVTVEAFRAAEGDADDARHFWAEPLVSGDASARELVSAGQGGAALLSISAHASQRRVAVDRPFSPGMARFGFVAPAGSPASAR